MVIITFYIFDLVRIHNYLIFFTNILNTQFGNNDNLHISCGKTRPPHLDVYMYIKLMTIDDKKKKHMMKENQN